MEERGLVLEGKVLAKRSPLFGGLSKGQRDYLTYRLIGIEEGIALQWAQKKLHTLERWERDGNFIKVEAEILGNRELYIQEAYADIVTATGLVVDKALFELAVKALDWESIEREDKPYVMKALEILKKVSLPPPGSGTTVYEEMIKRIRRIE